MGRVWSTYVKRPAKNWNIENRAQRHIEKQDRPSVAPRHPTTTDIIDQFVREHPEIREEITKKDQQLADMLKGMVVNPNKFGEIVSKPSQPSHRPLPEDRKKPPDTEFGYLEPEVIRPGRCTVRQALDFIGEHFKDPASAGSAESIAQKYNLDVSRVRHVLKYFHVFNVQMPKTDRTPDSGIALQPGIFGKQAGIQSGKKDDKSIPSFTK
jgi:NADH dehydrogenase [ubiquinone] 1 alpha subcomplex assembly factor 4